MSRQPARSRWTVLEVETGSHHAHRRALARCECGTVKRLTLGCITAGRSLSCGCLRSEVTTARSTKHGSHSTPEYNSWQAMRQRCRDPKVWNYKYYGALGVIVCAAWDDFAAFLSDMGPKPTPKHTIDRIDPTGNYEPANCRWATHKEQMQNLRARHHAQSK